MKKTDKTALTAAVFAAALGLSPVNSIGADYSPSEDYPSTVYGPPEYFATMTEPAETTRFDPYENELPGVYGPPEWFETEEEEVQTTAFDPSNIIPQPAYGPPETVVTTESDYHPEYPIQQPVYGPPLNYPLGDYNHDGTVDVFDVIKARQIIAQNDEESYDYFNASVSGDMNKDGKLNVADLVLLSKFMTGNNETENESEIQTTAPPAEIPETTETRTTVAPLYGPPIYYGE